jgi:hypothetical protein
MFKKTARLAMSADKDALEKIRAGLQFTKDDFDGLLWLLGDDGIRVLLRKNLYAEGESRGRSRSRFNRRRYDSAKVR